MTNTDLKNTAPKQPQEPVRKKYVLPSNPNKAMQEMMTTIDKLRLTMVEETNVLKDADTKTFLAMQDKKIDVARDYLEGMTQLIARKEELKKADPALTQRLEKMRLQFAETVHDNHAALARMQNGMKRLGERIMETAREAARRQEQIVYGANGHMLSGSKATIGVNESA